MEQDAKEIKNWPIGDVIPYSKNAKIHDPAQIMKIAKSIKDFGFQGYILVDEEGVIIAGHGRRLAALQLGMKFIPVGVAEGLSKEKVKALRLADNRVAEGDIDGDLLHEELLELSDLDIDMTSMGFDERELDFLTDDLSEMDVESLIEDLDAEVSEQSTRIEEKSKAAGERVVSLSEAFGFKGMTPDQARNMNKFMAKLEDDSGMAGADALDDFVSELVSDW